MLLRRSACASIAFVSVCCASAPAQEALPIDLKLESTATLVIPRQSVQLKLTVRNRGTQEVALDPVLLSDDLRSQYLDLRDPTGKVVSHRQVQPRAASVESDDPQAHYTKIAPHEEHVFELVVGCDLPSAEPLFRDAGQYELSVVLEGVRSNVLAIGCVAVPVSEQPAAAILERLEAKKLLDAFYNPYCLDAMRFRGVDQELSAVAWSVGSSIYAGQARLTLASADLWHAAAAADATRRRELLMRAEQWLAPISSNFELNAVVEQRRKELRELRAQTPKDG